MSHGGRPLHEGGPAKRPRWGQQDHAPAKEKNLEQNLLGLGSALIRCLAWRSQPLLGLTRFPFLQNYQALQMRPRICVSTEPNDRSSFVDVQVTFLQTNLRA
jgi:hypothetical protein